MKKALYAFTIFCLALISSNNIYGQCEIFSSDGDYSVQVALKPTVVVPNLEDCPLGYNWNVRIAYNIVFKGDTPPASLFTLQGNLYCDGQATFFSLPTAGGMGDTITVGDIFRNETDCAIVNLDSLGCDSIILQIEGPGIPDTSFNCNILDENCPDQANITANEFCISIVHDSIVPPLVDSILFEGMTYFYVEGDGTEEDPAFYQSGGGNGACNATQSPLEGELVINGDTCNYQSGILPVTFVSLSASEVDEDLMLSWTVLHEEEVSYYMVQLFHEDRWVSLADVAANTGEGSAMKHYDYTATSLPLLDRYLFRVVSMDQDGAMSYSDVTQIRKDNSDKLLIAPNPLGNNGQLSIGGIDLGKYQVQIIDPITAQRWNVQYVGAQLQLPELPSATYMIQFAHRENGAKLHKKLVKM